MNRPLRAFAPVMVVLVVAAVTAGCSRDADTEPPTVAAATVGAETEDLLVHGTVERNGRPVAGADVRLSVLSARGMITAEEGEEVPVLEPAGSTTAKDGTFALRVDPDDVPTEFLDPERTYLNVDLMVEDGGTGASWSTTVHLVGEPQVWRSSEQAAPADSALMIGFDVGTAQITKTDSFGESETNDLPTFDLSGRD